MDCFKIFPSHTTITVLLHHKKHFYAGEGSFLRVYSSSSLSHQLSYQIFDACIIHGIQVLKDDADVVLCVYGGRHFKIVSWFENLKIKEKSKQCMLPNWICHCCHPQTTSNEDVIFFILANNSLIAYDYSSNLILQSFSCQESCILYSAKIFFEVENEHLDKNSEPIGSADVKEGGATEGRLIMVTGTVFSQIVIWVVPLKRNSMMNKEAKIPGFGGNTPTFPQSSDSVQVSHRLSGHDGVILDVDWNRSKQILCSVSDDRSIWMWRMVSKGGSAAATQSWESCSFVPCGVLYGHKARVWRCKLLQDFVLSAGEDATLLLWDYEGKLVKRVEGHRGRSIRSITTNQKQDLILTGGEDSSIRAYHMREIECSPTSKQLQLPLKQHMARTVEIIKRNLFILLTDDGSLYLCKNGQFNLLRNLCHYQSYSVMQCNSHHTHHDEATQVLFAAVGNIRGSLIILKIDDLNQVEVQAYEGKVMSIHWLSSLAFLTCGVDGRLTMWEVTLGSHNDSQSEDSITSSGQTFSLKKIKSYILPPSSKRVVTGCCVTFAMSLTSKEEASPKLMCGDATGSIYFYELGNGNEKPIRKEKRVMGELGVTWIGVIGREVYCCGREGCVRVYGDGGIVWSIQTPKGFDWLTRVFHVRGDVIISGFISNEFVLYNKRTNSYLLRCDCGGGHRSHHFYHALKERSQPDYDVDVLWCCLLFVKKRSLVVFEREVSLSTLVVKGSLHGVQIHCVVGIRHDTHSSYVDEVLLTGAEDGTIGQSCVRSSCHEHDLRESHVTISCCLKTHRGGVKSIKAIYYGKDRMWLFTVGGDGVLKAWKLEVVKKNNNNTGDDKKEKIGANNEKKNSEIEKVDKEINTKVGQKEEQDNQYDSRLQLVSENSLSEDSKKCRKPWKQHHCDLSLETRYTCMDVVFVCVCGELVLREDACGGSCSDGGRVNVFIVVGCSLGFVRIFFFDGTKLHRVAASDFHSKCLLQVKKFTASGQHWLASTATDGVVSIWNLEELIEGFLRVDKQGLVAEGVRGSGDCGALTREEQEIVWSPSCHTRVHLSGINSIDVSLDHKPLIVTGGDDSSINFSVFDAQNSTVSFISSFPKSHSSQITGLKLLSRSLMLSCSVDQRLTMWSISASQGKLKRLKCVVLDVSDISHMHTTQTSQQDCVVFVVGNGLQRVSLKLP